MSLSGSKEIDHTVLTEPTGRRERVADGGHGVTRSRPLG